MIKNEKKNDLWFKSVINDKGKTEKAKLESLLG